MFKKYLLFIILSNFIFSTQNIVVAELFTETWWPYCPDARSGLRQLNETAQFFIPLIWEGDGSHPSPNYGSRGSLYGVSGLPHVEFGGYIESVGGGGDMYPTYLSRYNQLVNNNSPLSISSSSNISNCGNNIIVEAEINVTSQINTTNNQKLLPNADRSGWTPPKKIAVEIAKLLESKENGALIHL